jgi:hypothetical protein
MFLPSARHGEDVRDKMINGGEQAAAGRRQTQLGQLDDDEYTAPACRGEDRHKPLGKLGTEGASPAPARPRHLRQAVAYKAAATLALV